MSLLLLNKPFQVLTRFSRADERSTLADYVSAPGLYPVGRLDYDSEGLLLLTDDGALQAFVSHPRHRVEKTYWAQVEGVPEPGALASLRTGVRLPDGLTRPAGVRSIDEPSGLWPRDPPIRYRAKIPTSWIELVISEGRNRQVRRMTAAVGLPTLRLIRAAVGPFTLAGLEPGATRVVDPVQVEQFRKTLGGGRPPPISRRDRAGDRSASRPRGPVRS